MARGALRNSRADIAIAVSGVLGPAPDDDGNPVGLVFFCVARRGRSDRVVKKRYAKATDNRLRYLAVAQALKLATTYVAKQSAR